MDHQDALFERARLCRALARAARTSALGRSLDKLAADYELRARADTLAFRAPDYHRHAVAPPQLG